MTTIALTNDDQKHIDTIIQTVSSPNILMSFLHDLIGHKPNTETLNCYLHEVNRHPDSSSHNESVVQAAVALQRHKMIEYERTASNMNLYALSAAFPFLSSWEQRVYRDHIMEYLRQELPENDLFQVISELQKCTNQQFTNKLPEIINTYIK